METPFEQVEREMFQEFIKTKAILICDENAAARSSIFNVFKDLGAAPHQLHLVNNYEHAVAQILQVKPQIVVTEYHLGNKCGLELFQMLREQRPKDTDQSIFLIVTGDTSQTAAARSLEEEIDSYILKPYTLEQIRKIIMKCAVEKIKPSPYRLQIEKGKKLLSGGQLDEAETCFHEALKLSESPALAHYYLGQIRMMRQILNEAKDSFQKGLTFNKIHYRCLVGLYDLLKKEQKNEEAYEVVKKISKYFPANPARMVEVLRLAVVTGQYEDIEKYYSIFMQMDERNEALVRYTCAALIVCGKYYLSTQLGSQRAIALFKKAAVTGQGGSGQVKLLKEMILTLADYGLHREAAEFLTRFPPEFCDSNDFIFCRFMVFSGGGSLGIVLDQGRALLAKGIREEKLYEVMIKKEVEAKHIQAAEDLCHQATKLWPDKKSHFENYKNQAIQAAQAA